MSDYDRIYVSEEIDINKTDGLREYNVCHCNYLLVTLRFSFKIWGKMKL